MARERGASAVLKEVRRVALRNLPARADSPRLLMERAMDRKAFRADGIRPRPVERSKGPVDRSADRHRDRPSRPMLVRAAIGASRHLDTDLRDMDHRV